MPYINLIKKQKKLEEFSEIEKGIDASIYLGPVK